MAEAEELDYILSDCFLAVGQAVGTAKTVDFDVVIWWHRRYRRAFHHAMTTESASWAIDRGRVTAVGRYLGQRAVKHAGTGGAIERPAAMRASDEIERGCQLKATREAVAPIVARTCANGGVLVD